MSPIDQAVIDTANATNLQAWMAVVQTVIALIVVALAVYEFRKWRKELLGSKKIDLAIRLGNTAINVRETFKAARASFGYPPKFLRTEQTTDNPYTMPKIDTDADEAMRIQPIQRALADLSAIRWEISVLFPSGEWIDEEIQVYADHLGQLVMALWLFYDSRETNESHRTRIAPPEPMSEFPEAPKEMYDDKFADTINENTEKLLRLARKYIG